METKKRNSKNFSFTHKIRVCVVREGILETIKIAKEGSTIYNYSLLSSRALSTRTPAILLQSPFILHMGAGILSGQTQQAVETLCESKKCGK